MFELGSVAVKPARLAAESWRAFFENPFNPWAHTLMGRHTAALCQVFERSTRRYGKPTFDIPATVVDGRSVSVSEKSIWQRPFCRLVHFQRDLPARRDKHDPKILIVAPMSGHFATLLRGTVETFLPNHDVYITDWQDARCVPAASGRFDLDDYIDYVKDMISLFNGDVHVFAVCQPAVPVLAAVAMMEEDGDTSVPQSLMLAGGPVDTRISPTRVNVLAEQRGTDWFYNNVITSVPSTQLGHGRPVYPGFLQLTGFMTMNLDRHLKAHKDLFRHLVDGDGDSADKHRAFYDEYLAVMDLTAEFYLQTIDSVFVRHLMPKGEFTYRGRSVRTEAINRTALMTIEGEKDDITGAGQCHAAMAITPGISDARKFQYTCEGVGHYGIFNGSRFRNDIATRIAQFVRTYDSQREHINPELNLITRKRRAKLYHRDDIADIAFSFAPANDVEPDPTMQRRRSRPPSNTWTKKRSTAYEPQTAPFKFITLLGRLMIDGFFHMPVRQSTANRVKDENSRTRPNVSNDEFAE